MIHLRFGYDYWVIVIHNMLSNQGPQATFEKGGLSP